MRKNFKRIKEFLMTFSILKVPDMDKKFLVCMDASKEVLKQIFDARWSSDRLHFKEIEKA
jgi:hypothetical protein